MQEGVPLPDDQAHPLKAQCSDSLSGMMGRLILTERRYLPLLFWALIVGAVTGFLGGIFRISLNYATDLLLFVRNWAQSYDVLNFLVPFSYSAVLLTISIYLVRRFAPETGGSGVQEVEGALEGLRKVRWKRVLPVKFIAGLFSLGAGLALGREGPTIQMGGATGGMISRLFKSSNLDRHCLIAAGAGAGLAAAFNSPLAGILFVFEEMRPQFKYNFLSVQAVMVACAVSDIVVRALTSQAPIMTMPAYQWPPLNTLWIFVLLGSLFGFLGFFFNHFLVRVLNFITSWKGIWRNLTGVIIGGGIGLMGWWIPSSIGGGYSVIPDAFQFQFITWFMITLFGIRFAMTVISYGSGAPGGIFAPMLALGTLFGIWFGEIVISISPGFVEHPGIFAIAGMGALFSATVRAPLTGIALAIEMTGNYSQILPLILTCMSASIVAQGLGGKPIYTVLLQRTLRLATKVKNGLKPKGNLSESESS